MLVKGLVDEDFVNYKKPSMFIIFPYCTFKCDKEANGHCCQNSGLASACNIDVDVDAICTRYFENPITSSIVCGGLEPFDSFNDLQCLLHKTREHCDDDIVIYTGYTKTECEENGWIETLSGMRNIIIKFGRFIPNQNGRFDDVLGVNLSSDNQYAERIS